MQWQLSVHNHFYFHSFHYSNHIKVMRVHSRPITTTVHVFAQQTHRRDAQPRSPSAHMPIKARYIPVAPTVAFKNHSVPAASPLPVHFSSNSQQCATKAPPAKRDDLEQNFHHQIDQLQKSNESLLSTVAIEASQRTTKKVIQPSSHLINQENTKQQQTLTKLQHQVQHLFNFCNREMMHILQFVAQAQLILTAQLERLRKETSKLESEEQICKNVEKIGALEKIEQALHLLEKAFQIAQRPVANLPETHKNQREEHIDALLVKTENLYQQHQFLQACKQQLNGQVIYAKEDLQQLMKAFELEKENLHRQTSSTRQQLHKTEGFANELTNHLLDYAQILEASLVSLQNKQPGKEETQVSIPPLTQKEENISPAQANFLHAAKNMQDAFNNLVNLLKKT